MHCERSAAALFPYNRSSRFAWADDGILLFDARSRLRIAKGGNVKLIIQPEDGPAPLLSALKSAKKSVEVAIFRFDRADIETTLKTIVAKGVKVTALIADVN